jgi:hypothetical protein
MSTSDSWCSPPEIANPLEEFFRGPVDVDPCSNEHSIIKAYRAYRQGGLVLPWKREPSRGTPQPRGTVYENNPYSQGDLWTAKAIAEMACGNVLELVRLGMFQTSCQWWADMCNLPRRNPRILGLKRIAFLSPFLSFGEPTANTCRFEPALVYFGPRTALFTRTFAHLTMWSTWGRP